MASNGSSRNRMRGPWRRAAAKAIFFLSHAVAVVHDQRVGCVGEPQHSQQLARTLTDHRFWHGPEESAVGEQLRAREPVEEAKVLGQHTDAGLGGAGVPPDVDAVHHRRAGIGAKQAGCHSKCRGLPRPVGAHQPEEAPVGDGEGDGVHRSLGTEGLGQARQEQGIPGGRRVFGAH
jgi:hypothetical protein